jgi:hypothetical protein
MRSLRSLEGEMLIDHRCSMGVPEEIMVAQGLPADAGKKETVWESATVTCNHCETQVILNPDRSRARGFCMHCQHYLCDECEAEKFLGKACYPFKAKCSDYLEAVDKGVSPAEAHEAIFIKGMRPAQSVVLLNARDAREPNQPSLIFP